MLDMVRNLGANPVRLKDISDRQNIPLHYLEQLFRKLRIAGIVHSVRGPGGGYIMNQEPKTITVKNLLDAVEEHAEVEEDLVAPTDEANKTKAYFGTMVENHTNELLEKTTLEDLLK